MFATFLDSHHMKFYILDIIVIKYAEKKIMSISENGFHVLFSREWLMYTKNFEIYKHTVFGIHIGWKQALLTLKIVYMLIVLVFFEGRKGGYV
jgi:hypothetical protein